MDFFRLLGIGVELFSAGDWKSGISHLLLRNLKSYVSMKKFKVLLVLIICWLLLVMHNISKPNIAVL